jgi:tetratricopeptide (TPR) repeat protein
MGTTFRNAGRLVVAAGATLAVVVAVWASCRKAEPERHWTWQSAGLPETLAAARAQGASVLVEVYATWCPTCHQLEHDVFQASAGRLPADRLVGVRIDFDTPAGQEVATGYRVMGLPTTLVLDADGKELGRIEGYETVDGWVAALGKALAGHDESAEILARFARSPGDPELTAQAGAVELARGNEDEGLRLLEQARKLDPDATKDAYLDATRTLGRWFFRVRHQHERALAYFRDGAAKAGDTDAGWGFQYWTAMSLHALGRADEAQALLDRLIAAHAGRAEPVALKAEVLYMVGGDDDAALALAREAARIDPTDDWNHYLVAVLCERLGDRTAAATAARRAVELAPDKAIYLHLLERLSAVGAP